MTADDTTYVDFALSSGAIALDEVVAVGYGEQERQELTDVTASGQELLLAIWRERRAELGMEQHRWFDIVRQGQIMEGRTADLMRDVGENYEPFMEDYPIPQSEVDLTGLEQNPEY